MPSILISSGALGTFTNALAPCLRPSTVYRLASHWPKRAKRNWRSCGRKRKRNTRLEDLEEQRVVRDFATKKGSIPWKPMETHGKELKQGRASVGFESLRNLKFFQIAQFHQEGTKYQPSLVRNRRKINEDRFLKR